MMLKQDCFQKLLGRYADLPGDLRRAVSWHCHATVSHMAKHHRLFVAKSSPNLPQAKAALVPRRAQPMSKHLCGYRVRVSMLGH
jgi:hypothetical protein